MLYGHSPRHFGISNEVSFHAPDLHQWLTERHLLEDVVKHHLHRAQQRMKDQTDKNRSERSFQEGDMVYMKLQPYVQSSVANRCNKKLSFRYYGPFKILQKIGQVAYKLDLPPTSRIHPVIHVSQLKKHVPKAIEVSDDLTSVYTDPDQLLET